MKHSVFFLHIPKSAGTTMHKIFENQYRTPSSRLPFYNYGDSLCFDFSRVDKAAIKAVYGHASLEVIQREFDFKTITLLRSPRERLLSHYIFIKNTPGHHQYELLKDRSLKEVLDQGLIKDFDNTMIRYLCSDLHRDFGAITDKDADLAIDSLKKNFYFYGLTEYFDEFVVDCRTELNWKRTYYIPENVSSVKKPVIDAETEALITRYTAYGQRVYDFAHETVTKRIEAKKEFYERAIRSNLFLNSLYGIFRKGKSFLGLK
jgi:hypothetical protein